MISYEDVPSLVDYETRKEVMDYVASKVKFSLNGVELGIFLGGTVFRLAQKLRENNIHTTLFAIDNWCYDNISKQSFDWCNTYSKEYTDYVGLIQNGTDGLLAFLKARECFKFMSCIDVIVANSVVGASFVEDNSLDYLFMDAAHGYGGVMEELKVWYPKLKEKSFCAIHDYSGGVRQAVEDFLGHKIQTTSNRATGIIKDTL